MRQTRTTPRRDTAVLLMAVLLCLLASVGMVLALTLGHRQVQAPFVPPPFDTNAHSGSPAVPDELDWQELDAQAFRVSICGTVRPTANGAEVWFTNPLDNQVWLKLRILDTVGNILGETGLIKPGEHLQYVALDLIPTSGTNIVVKIMAYEPETYHSAGAVSLNTSIGG